MTAIFLSASIPVAGRGNYFETANPFLIQCAVREFVLKVIGKRLIVWGGHPAITPMIWVICRDLNVDYSKSVQLYQSQFFADRFPEENIYFSNGILTPTVANSREESLLQMRREMLSRDDLTAAVFIGGMEGVKEEFDLFKQYHPNAKVLPVPGPGGAARDLARQLGVVTDDDLNDVDFARLFHNELGEK